MIECSNCSKKLFSMSDVTNVKCVGFALYGNCRHCEVRLSVSGLWRRTKVAKYVELPRERERKERLVLK